MQSINALADGASNLGSLQKIQFLPVESINLFDYVNFRDGLEMKIFIETAIDWLDAIGTEENYYFNCNSQVGSHGESYDLHVGLFSPKLNVNDEANFEEMKSYRFIILAYDQNDNVRVCGSLKNPLQFTTKSTSGTKFADRNGTLMEWYGIHTNRPPYYLPTIHEDYYGDAIGGDLPTQASATFNFIAQPSEADQFTITPPDIAPIIFTFLGSPSGETQIQIGATAEGTAANMYSKIHAYFNAHLVNDLAIVFSTPRFTISAVAAGAYDGSVGNEIILTWNNHLIIDVSSPLELSGGAD